KLEIRKQLERALQDAISAELATIRTQIDRAIPADVIHAILSHARFGATTEEAWDSMQHLDGINDLPGATSADLPKWMALRCFCMTKDKLRKQAGPDQGFRSGGEHKQQKQDFKDLFESIAEAPYGETLCAALSRLDGLPPCQYEDQQWESLLALFRVLLLTVANLRSVFAERGEVDHTEVALAAKAALGDEGHPTDLALHLGYKIQHLLVDEFQDTSVSQTELLERLIQTWSPESGATLFVVGDPMQSIYGFRQAEVTLFQRARTSGFGAGMWPLEPISLRTNFRSRPELVAWFNSTFNQILSEDSEVTGAVKYAGCDAARENSTESEVICEAAAPKNLAEEAERVVELVQRELRKGTQSIAILVRSRRHLIHVAPALHKAGIRFRAKDIDVLNERQTVRDLHSLTRAMLHLGDRTAWLSLLRAPWCGLSLADLLELCRGERRRTIWNLLQLRGENLSAHGKAVLQRIRPVLEEALVQRGRTPLRELIGGLWFSLGGPAACVGDERQDKLRDADTYLSLLEELEADGAIDEDQLENEIASLFAQPDTSPDIRVEIMTIHGAKGLEFDAVILPGLNRRTDQNRTQLLNWREQVIENHRDLLLAPMDPVASKYDQTPIAKYITMLSNECSAEESKRLFYVAATRARERLYLVATIPEEDKKPEKGSMF
ncbi:MAG TPA: 3'-5' exonuclease, partial [Terriglobales bacterium]